MYYKIGQKNFRNFRRAQRAQNGKSVCATEIPGVEKRKVRGINKLGRFRNLGLAQYAGKILPTNVQNLFATPPETAAGSCAPGASP